MEIGIVLGILKAGLDLWNSKEKSKYKDRVIELEKKYNAELAKPFNDRSQLVLDKCLLELRTIAKNFIQFSSKE